MDEGARPREQPGAAEERACAGGCACVQGQREHTNTRGSVEGRPGARLLCAVGAHARLQHTARLELGRVRSALAGEGEGHSFPLAPAAGLQPLEEGLRLASHRPRQINSS